MNVLNSDLQIKTYDSPSDLGLQAGSNLHIVDVFKAMPANSIFQCTCEAEATFSTSDYPVSQTGSAIGFGVITINKGQGNRNSIIFSQSLSAGTHDLWINSFTYTSDEYALSSWNKVTTNADLESGLVEVNAAANGVTEFEVEFPRPFSSAPTVLVCISTGRPDLRSASVYSRTVTGFTGAVYNNSTANKLNVYWIATN